jgi:hypothetical protein
MVMNTSDKGSTTCINSCFKKLSSLCCDSVQKDYVTNHVEKPDDMCEQEFGDWVDVDHNLHVSTVLMDKKLHSV